MGPGTGRFAPLQPSAQAAPSFNRGSELQDRPPQAGAVRLTAERVPRHHVRYRSSSRWCRLDASSLSAKDKSKDPSTPCVPSSHTGKSSQCTLASDLIKREEKEQMETQKEAVQLPTADPILTPSLSSPQQEHNWLLLEGQQGQQERRRISGGNKQQEQMKFW